MKSFLSGWKEAQRKLTPADHTLWLFDYDGTLTPIALRPEWAILDPKVRHLLRTLSRRFPHRVGVISGRPLSQLHRHVRLKGLIYGGDHGSDIQGPHVQRQRVLSKAARGKLLKLKHTLEEGVAGIPGMWVEDKNWTVCLHYRETRRRDQQRVKKILESARELVQAIGFTVLEGRKVFEIIPDARWNKGEAVRWLKKKLGASRVFYVGDDATDETVFRRLGSNDVTVRVGPRLKTHAAYRLRNPKEVAQVIRKVLSL